jgi:hypothetical protein
MIDEINIVIERIKDKYYYYKFLKVVREYRKLKSKERKDRFGSKFERCISDWLGRK